jgi:hypothetical protein
VIDDKTWGVAPNLMTSNRVDLARAQAQADCKVVKEIPLRLKTKEAREQLVPLLLRVPIDVRLGHGLHRYVRHTPKPSTRPKEAKYGSNKDKVLIDRLGPKMPGQGLLEGVQRRRVDLLNVKVAENRFDPFPKILVAIPRAVLHARSGDVLSIAFAEDKFPGAGQETLARIPLRK